MVETASQNALLRVGVLASSGAPFEPWHERLIRELSTLPGAAFAGVYLDHGSTAQRQQGPFERTVVGIDNLVSNRGRRAQRPAWSEAPVCRSEAGGEPLPDIAIDLRAGGRPVGATCTVAREVWSIDLLEGGGAPEVSGIQLALSAAGTFTVSLQRHENEKRVRLDAAVCSGRRRAVRNAGQIRQAAVAMIIRTLKARLAQAPRLDVPERGFESPVVRTAVVRELAAVRYAGNLSAYAASRGLVNLSKHVSSWVGALPPHFRLHHARGSPLDFALSDSRPLTTSQRHYFADPFLFREAGRLWVFFEVFDYRSNQGSIGVAELTRDGLGNAATILTGNGHWSYPQVFRHGSEIYMLPETCSRRRVEIWRATRFPFEWELVSTALEGAVAVDSNLFCDGDQWWLFSNLSFDPESDVGLELSLYQTNGPHLGDLRPHMCNPVVVDARYARNGGRIFKANGKTYRPAQSQEYGQYGYGLYLMEIVSLDSTTYSERPVRFIAGCHHIDSDGEDVIFDIRRGTAKPAQARAAQGG